MAGTWGDPQKTTQAADAMTAQKVIEMFASLNLPVTDDAAAIEAAVKKNQARYLRDLRSPDPAVRGKAEEWTANVDALRRRRPKLLEIVYEAYRDSNDLAIESFLASGTYVVTRGMLDAFRKNATEGFHMDDRLADRFVKGYIKERGLKEGANPQRKSLPGFRHIRTLGSGGFASTELYEDSKGRYGRYVVVKIPHNREREEDLILGDILLMARLESTPYIAKIHDIRRIDGRYVLIMEYVDGQSLRQTINEYKDGRGLPVDRAVKYGLHVACGLRVAHACRRVHRDIKPDNIIIDTATGNAKILDFGIASILGRDGVFETTFGHHTPIYSAPEILYTGKGDHRVDIFSLGVTH